MSGLLLAASAAAAVAVSLAYPDLSEFARDRTERLPYGAIAGAGLAHDPYIIEPLADARGIAPRHPNVFGYDDSVHDPRDDSVTLVYDDRDLPDRHEYRPWNLCRGESPTGLVHTQTYAVNQTFAYCCYDYERAREHGIDRDHHTLSMYQYRGTSTFQGERSYVFVRFELDVPRDVPCEFPAYLRHTVDVYDAGWFDSEFDLGGYGGPAAGEGAGRAEYAEPVRHMVLDTPVFVDRIDAGSLGGWGAGSGSILARMEHNPDDTITATYRGPGGGPEYERTYEPGQTFLAHCAPSGRVTAVWVYDYRGSVQTEIGPAVLLVHFGGYTRAPVPCDLPGVVDHTVDAFDTGAFERQRPELGLLDELATAYEMVAPQGHASRIQPREAGP